MAYANTMIGLNEGLNPFKIVKTIATVISNLSMLSKFANGILLSVGPDSFNRYRLNKALDRVDVLIADVDDEMAKTKAGNRTLYYNLRIMGRGLFDIVEIATGVGIIEVLIIPQLNVFEMGSDEYIEHLTHYKAILIRTRAVINRRLQSID